MKCHSNWEFVLKNADVQLTIYSTIYSAYMTHSLRGCTAPKKLVIDPKVDCPTTLLVLKPGPGFVHTKALLFDPILFTVVLSNQITLVWSSQSLDLAQGPARWWDSQLWGLITSFLGLCNPSRSGSYMKNRW